ncbi:MAG: NAD(P)H-binding protein [Gemmatimonadetes bacterium]|nr:NAD(P)H-binding protein [Gemmatimonadota bacterium]
MRRVLVLGATGAIGAHAVRACLASGWMVRALVRPSSRLEDLAGLDVETVQGDVRSRESLEPAFDGCAAFVHAAGFYPTNSFRARAAPRDGLETVRPVFAAALAAGGVRGVYVSSASTLSPAERAGHVGGASGIAGEASGIVGQASGIAGEPPGGAYFAAKRAMERAALEAVDRGLPLVLVHPTLCIGEYDRKPTSGRIVLQAASGRLPFVISACLNVVYTGDVGLGILRALEAGEPGARHVLAGENTSFRWLVRQSAFEAGAREPRMPLPLRAARIGARVADAASLALRRPALATTGIELLARSTHMGGAATEEALERDAARAALGVEEPVPAVESVRRAVRWFRRVGMLAHPAGAR